MAERGSLRARVTAAASVVVLVLLVAGGALFVWLLDTRLVDGQHAAAADQAELLAERMDGGADPAALVRDDESIVQVLAGGRVVAASDGATEEVDGPLPASDGARVVIDDEPHIVAVEAVGRDRVVVVARSLESVGEATAATAGLLAVAIPLLDLAVGALVWVLTGRALRPVDRMRAEVDAIHADDLSRRVEAPHGASELRRLASTMNRLLERVDASQQTQRRFVADASHELRSPIASLRQHAEVAVAHPEATSLGELADVVEAESARLAELVDAMLVLARSGEPVGARRDDVDLDDLALAEAARLRSLGGVDVAAEISPARVVGDASLLARVLRNLGDNARRHARGRIRIALATDGGDAVLRVEDDGVGIPEADRARVFERFVRLDEARSRDAGGAGLGLAIVAEVVRRHGGSVASTASELGGAAFLVRLPIRT